MKQFCYSISVLFFCGWLLTFLVFHAGGAVHVLFMLALISLLQAIITCPKKKYNVEDMREGHIDAADTVKEQRA